MSQQLHTALAKGEIETSFPESPFVVMKFGGRSVATADNWAKIAKLIQARRSDGLIPVIVHSAVAGVSNALEDLLNRSPNSV